MDDFGIDTRCLCLECISAADGTELVNVMNHSTEELRSTVSLKLAVREMAK